MKISTRGRYSLRLLIDIAIHSDGKPVRIKDIAIRQGISDKYLEQIISSLNKAGFVKGIRGSQGGYYLAVKPEHCTAGMVLRTVEGDLAPVGCIDAKSNGCRRKGNCATLLLWQKLDKAIEQVVDSVTLADLVSWQKAMDEQS